MGGLARVVSVVRQTKEAGTPALLLDVGDLSLPLEGDKGPDALLVARNKALAAYRILGRIGVDAHVPGELDLLLGLSFLQEATTNTHVPVVATNLSTREGAPLFARSRIVERAGLRVLLLGLLDPALVPSSIAAQGLTVDEPVSAAQRELDAAGEVDLVVVGAHVGEGLEAALLSALPRVDVLIGGHGGVPSPVRRVDGAGIWARAGNKGRFLLQLDLELSPTWEPGDRFEDGVDRARAREELEATEAQWAELQRLLDGRTPLEVFGDDPARRFRFAELASSRSALQEQIDAGQGKDSYAFSLVPLGPELPDDPETKDDLDALRRGEVARFRAAAPARPAPLAPATPASVGYAGPMACIGCHPLHVNQWQLTPHARAFETLVAKEKEFDPSCVGCHTAGYREPGGFSDVALASLFGGVQCESCHGPSAAHAAAPGAPPPPKTTGEPLCLRCHTKENDDTWDHARKLPLVRHWGADYPSIAVGGTR